MSIFSLLVQRSRLTVGSEKGCRANGTPVLNDNLWLRGHETEMERAEAV